MRSAVPFDHLGSKLEGTNLIEASAGTGKTYAITGLFLRLLLEKGFSSDNILVVTFTEAATEELRDRIRKRIRECLDALSGIRSRDRFVCKLAEEYMKNPAAGKMGRNRLSDALRDFDQASIFTIHGFCLRMLRENAFESGCLFDTELVPDQHALKKEIVEDFWRRNLYHASPLFIRYLVGRNSSPESFLSLLGNRISRPDLEVIPEVSIPDTSIREKEFTESFEAVREAWRPSRDEVANILLTDDRLNRSKYRTASVPRWIQRMDDFTSSDVADPALFEGFDRFTGSFVARSLKKDRSAPAHPFFESCEALLRSREELVNLFDTRILGLKRELFEYAQSELALRKRDRNVQSFDDLLVKLRAALEGEGGRRLAESIRGKYQAALIDEFQDTDPIQYAIFKKVFDVPDRALFLIGDPKQAIYSFRGADVFAYMSATKDVNRRYSIGENWRSEPGLVDAVNTIFSGADRPFIYDRIPFHEVRVPKDKEHELLRIEGENDRPFQLWFLETARVMEAAGAARSNQPISRARAMRQILEAVAGEISRLIALSRTGGATLGERPLTEGDIAVLVRRNSEARKMKETLAALDIPAVLYSTANLFDSHEVLEMERVLSAIAKPNEEHLLRAALATDILGLKGEDLANLMEDDAGWEEWLSKFRGYRDLWHKQGFIRMFRAFMHGEEIQGRLMAFTDGERRNTDLLHLSEVLHQEWEGRKPGVAGLIKWLSEQRSPKSGRLDEHQLRLESDENAVKLVTIHRSKGLEYPVVFCPFTWSGSRISGSDAPLTFHDSGTDDEPARLVLDLGSPERDDHLRLAEKEMLAENLRLLYVALTRAKNRCYMVWGRFNRAGTSAPAYLFHHRGSAGHDDIVNAIDQEFRGLNDARLLSELEMVSERAGGSIDLTPMPAMYGNGRPVRRDEKDTVSCRTFTGRVDRQFRLSSFSFLISGAPHSPELADHDALAAGEAASTAESEELKPGEEPSGIFAFPKGARAGTFLHDIFEHLDFTLEDRSPMEALVDEKLREHGFALEWKDALCGMIEKVLSTPLDQSLGGFTLKRLRNEDRLNELEFYFPLEPLSPGRLKRIFQGCRGEAIPPAFPERIGRLNFSPTKGFMKGFMDLVFRHADRYYLVDWKSNHLGNRVEDYDNEKLGAAMERDYYTLQYLIYTVALDRYLHLRLPDYDYERHFGGVFYVFLRGVDPTREPACGIYRDRPPGGLVRELGRHLIAKAL